MGSLQELRRGKGRSLARRSGRPEGRRYMVRGVRMLVKIGARAGTASVRRDSDAMQIMGAREFAWRMYARHFFWCCRAGC